jgi:succinate dehydrogenase/fumarate reductase flavoprotein subunit
MMTDDFIKTDVLILGGGLAGCFAAIKAAENGVDVVVFEKAHIDRSGNGGTGLHRTPLISPEYNFSFEEFAKLNVEYAAGIADEDVSYAFAEDTMDRILDLESWGIKFRRDDGTFVLKQARDICPGNSCIWPANYSEMHNLKPILAKKVKSYENVRVINRTSAISLLNREGEVENDIVGAVGLNTRTGKFVLCQAKAVILTTGGSYRFGRHKDSLYAPSRFVECGAPTNAGEGQAMAYRAGAKLVNLEFAKYSNVWKDFSHWGGGPVFTACTPLRGDKKSIKPGPEEPKNFSIYKRIYNGGFNSEGPLYYDASKIEGYPEDKGEMHEFLVGLQNESTHLGYALWMKERGEDFQKNPVEFETHPAYLHNNQGGVYMNANSEATLKGLYVAGDVMGGGWRQSSGGAFVFGARAGLNASQYAKNCTESAGVNKNQVELEKKRILEPLTINPAKGHTWIELEDKARQIITEYGPPFTNDAKLKRGIQHLERIKTKYLPLLCASTPREMMRVSEVKGIFCTAEIYLKGALFRKESRFPMVSMLHKADYPERDDKNWMKHTAYMFKKGELELDTIPVRRL